MCDFGSVQNAAHPLRCMLIADGRGRTADEIWNDAEYCKTVAAPLA